MSNYQLYIFSLLSLFLFSCCSHKESDHEEEDHHQHSDIVLEPEKASLFGIEYEIVAPGSFHHVIKTSGEINSSSSDTYTIAAKKAGIITLAPGISQGVAVRKDERIASVSSEGVEGGDITQAALANLETARSEYERLRPLYEEGLVTTSVFKEAERAYNEAKALTGKKSTGASYSLVSPLDGTIQSLMLKSGEFAEVGTPVAVVSKNTNLTLKADLPSRESAHLPEIVSANFISESGQIVKLSDHNGKRISGHDNMVGNGYIPVFFSFTGNSMAFPGGFAEVYLLCGEKQGVLTLPREAFIEIQGNKYVYVAEDEHEYEKRLVKTGASDGERIEILEGVSEGDKVVSKGASIIRMAEVSSLAPPSHTHNH